MQLNKANASLRKRSLVRGLSRISRRLSFSFYRLIISVPAIYKILNHGKEIIRFPIDQDLAESQRPLALCWRMGEWKQEIVSKYLPDHDIGFVEYNAPPWTVATLRPDLLERPGTVFIVWGDGHKRALAKLAENRNIPLWQVEDGFLRSFGPGELHTRPNSLAFDKTGIYFDGTRPSDLENILNSIDGYMTPEIERQARAGIAIFKAARLSKYFSFVFDKPKPVAIDPDRQNVLVVGQMERDKSIRFGYPPTVFMESRRRYTNGSLAALVGERFESSKLFYKPHPDTVRFGWKQLPKVVSEGTFSTIDPLDPLPQTVMAVDRVATQTSLVGMEALIHGKQVSTFGYPFYAGWGLTDDQLSCDRRRRALTLEQLFAGTYLIYPKYIHPASDTLSDYFAVASYFLVEQLKYRDLAELGEEVVDLPMLKRNEEFLSAPARLLLYLTDMPIAGAQIDRVIALAEDAVLADFPHFSHLLIHTCNYDALKIYTDKVIDELNEDFESLLADRLLCENVVAQLAMVQRNANGRVLKNLGDFGAEIVERLKRDGRYKNLVVEYVRVLSNNLLYRAIENVLDGIESMEEISQDLMQRICSILGQAPSRSERYHVQRRALLLRAVGIYRSALDREFHDRYDLLLNAALVARAQNSPEAVEHAMDRLREAFPEDRFRMSPKHLARLGKLVQRGVHLVTIYEYLLRVQRFEYARGMAENMFFRESVVFEKSKMKSLYYQMMTPRQKRAVKAIWLSYYSARGDHRKVLSLVNQSPEIEDGTFRWSKQYAKALRGVGELAQSRSVLLDQRRRLKTPGQRLGVDAEVAKLSFAIETSEILTSYPQPKFSKRVVFLASQTCYNTLAMMTPALYELKKRGYAFVNLMEGMTAHELTNVPFIDQLAGSIPMRLHDGALQYEWTVDWDNKRVEAEGINFYQGFYERLSTQARTYWVDINQDAIHRSFMTQLYRTDFCLRVCEQILLEVVRRGYDVVLVSGNSHVTPFSAFRDFARAKDHPKLSFINCNVAYESYFSNLGSKFASTMAVTDMTLHKDRRAPFMALRPDFERWYQVNRANASYQAHAHDLIHMNRSSATSSDAHLPLVEWLESQRAHGKKVVCAFGKVPVDLNVPYDGGPAHTDMADWLNHTVQVARECPDILLLVKPHPHELRPEIALDLIEGFTELISGPIPANVRLLGHREINVHALAPHIDLAALWNGSSSLELTALGVPVLMAAYFGRHDYPVDLIYPKSREQYAGYLKAGDFPIPSEELREKAAFLIAYLGTNEISIRNEYSYRQITNDKVGIPRWRKDEIDRFLLEGDEGIGLIASRMTEKFARPPAS